MSLLRVFIKGVGRVALLLLLLTVFLPEISPLGNKINRLVENIGAMVFVDKDSVDAWSFKASIQYAQKDSTVFSIDLKWNI